MRPAANPRTHRWFIRALGVTAAALGASSSLVASSRRLPTAAPPVPPRGRLESSTDVISDRGDGFAGRTTAIGRGTNRGPDLTLATVPDSLTAESASRTPTSQRRTQDKGPAGADEPAAEPTIASEAALTAEEKAKTQAKEREALVKLYEATGGEEWLVNSGWLQGDPCDGWYGVTCNNEGYVSSLGLWRKSLTGPIPTEIGDLAQLEGLSLGWNALTGSIPTEIGQLKKLEGLNLGNNALTGPIPTEIGALTQISRLYLGKNMLAGTIPAKIRELKKLEELDLSSNTLTGPIPTEMWGLLELRELNLGDNALAGTIPTDIVKLRLLQHLDLDDNRLTGSIPADVVGNLTRLQTLDLSSNALIGPIPAEIGELKQLLKLYLDGNALTGPIPAEIRELKQLLKLYLHSNALSGRIPTEIGELKRLLWLYLHGNALSGPIPTEIGDLTQLEWLNIFDNALTGPIPAEMGNLTQLKWLYLNKNRLAGPIATGIGELKQLYDLSLHDNELIGQIPTEIAGLKELGYLDLKGNALIGQIPTEIGLLTQLWALDLSDNALTGSIPNTGIWELTQLRHLNLSRNSLTSTIPTQVRSMIALEKLSLNENRLTGTIPTEIRMVESLVELEIHSNLLTGNLPIQLAQLGNLTELEGLNLASNRLTGTVPWETMKSLSNIQSLDLSSNSLTGTLSDSVRYMLQLEELLLEHNELSGILPSQFGELTRLNTLRLKNNAFWGQIPADLGSLSRLQSLDLSCNYLSGSLPIELAWMSSLRELNISKNEIKHEWIRGEEEFEAIKTGLKGPIPAEYGDLAYIEILDLSGNLLTGSIPLELGYMGRLRYLSLADNLLSDTIPTTLGQLSTVDKVGHFFLGGNVRLEKPAPLSLCISDRFDLRADCAWCPQERSSLKRFYDEAGGQDWAIKERWDDPYDLPCTVNRTWHGISCNGEGKVVNITLSSNGLSGRISEEIGNLSALEHVDFNGNALQGTIPSQIGKLHNLSFLRLSYNGLTGSIPEDIGELRNLSFLHLHGNRLVGKAPTFIEFSPSDFTADCGSPSEFESPLACPDCTVCCNALGECHNQNKKKLTTAESTGIFIGAFVLFAGIATGLYRFSVKNGFISPCSANAEDTIGTDSVYSFLLSQRWYGWLISLVTLGLQGGIFGVFIQAAELDFGDDSKDWVYSWRCPLNSAICEDTGNSKLYGWIMFAVLMFAYLSRDFWNGGKLLAIFASNLECNRWRVLASGFFLSCITTLALYTSVVYNVAIARSNTELIVNAVIVLFVNELDEQFFAVMEVVCPQLLGDLNDLSCNEGQPSSVGRSSDTCPPDCGDSFDQASVGRSSDTCPPDCGDSVDQASVADQDQIEWISNIVSKQKTRLCEQEEIIRMLKEENRQQEDRLKNVERDLVHFLREGCNN